LTEEDIECPKCGGKVKVVEKLEKGERAIYLLECPKCGGKGKLIRIGEIGYLLECPKCGGKGKLIRIGEIGAEFLDFE